MDKTNSESKGSVERLRVVARVRPLLEQERDQTVAVRATSEVRWSL